MNIASIPVQPVTLVTPEGEHLPFMRAEQQASHVGRLMLPAGQTLSLSIARDLAPHIPQPRPIASEPPAAHNVKLLPLVALLPHNGLAIGGAILQAIRTLKAEADKQSKEKQDPQQKKKKKSLKALIAALMQSAKDQEEEQSGEKESSLKKRKAKGEKEKSKFSPAFARNIR